MFWRVVRIFIAIGIISTAIAIWNDPYCENVSFSGSRRLFFVSCTTDGGVPAGPTAFIMFALGVVVIISNIVAMANGSGSTKPSPQPSPPVQPLVSNPVVQQTPTAPQNGFCTACGNQWTASGDYCVRCGSPRN